MSEFYLNERMMELKVAEEHRQAGLRRLQKEIGADRTSWLARQRYWILSWLGCFLVSSGLQMLQTISPQSLGADGRAERKV
jgi:hypothetical protein